MSEAIFVYITCSNEKEAHFLASKAVEEKLAACGNILSPHRAVYAWEGKVQSEQETALILKTQSRHFNALEVLIADLHSYDCPCIVALPIEKGHVPFLEWVADETDQS